MAHAGGMRLRRATPRPAFGSRQLPADGSMRMRKWLFTSCLGAPKLPQLAPPHIIRENNLKVASLLDLAGTKASLIPRPWYTARSCNWNPPASWS